MPQNFEKLEKLIRYRFRDKGLLRQALTPPSTGLPTDNQRLEFFGDSVLHLCTTRLVYSAHPEWQEGPLSRLRGKIVSTDSLRAWAQDLNIVLERGPRSPKKNKAPSGKELADAVEALLAAVVLDSEASGEDGLAENGLENALKIIEARFGKAINAAGIGDWEQDDPKTALQERAAAIGLAVPVYELIERSGPEHAPVFSCSVKVGEFEAVAKGPTLKRAHMEAARQLLGLL
jgi:ribonuclease-3